MKKLFIPLLAITILLLASIVFASPPTTTTACVLTDQDFVFLTVQTGVTNDFDVGVLVANTTATTSPPAVATSANFIANNCENRLDRPPDKAEVNVILPITTTNATTIAYATTKIRGHDLRRQSFAT